MADPPEDAPAGGEHDQHGATGERRFDRRLLVPGLAIALLILVPIGIWAAGSGGGGDGLRVEQSVSAITGGPEIVVGIPEKYNNVAESDNKAIVVLVCFDGGGKTLFEANQDWPFIAEAGYDLPHAHQPVSDKQLKAVASCAIAGLKHELEGTLRRS